MAICDCINNIWLENMISNIEKTIYDVEPGSPNYEILNIISQEICQAYGEITKSKNDIYLWVDVENEAVVKGELNGTDVLQNRAVVEVISVGDTPGATDYIENIDYVVTECGISWAIPDKYGYGYGYGYGYATPYTGNYYNPWYPFGRKEPPTGNTYYVNYRYGVRNESLYDNFGRLIRLRKRDTWSYVLYRKAIKALIIASLKGPNKENIKDALSVLHPRAYIEIIEVRNLGWILNESILYTESDYRDPSVDTTDGTILITAGEGLREFIVRFHFAETLSTDDIDALNEIIQILKPADTIAYTQYIIGA